MALDPKSLPRDAETLRKMVVDLAEQLDRSLAEQNKYQSLLRELLDRKLPFARIGRIWPYVGDAHHPVIVYDYTPTRALCVESVGGADALSGRRRVGN